jgi:hypothetical protein
MAGYPAMVAVHNVNRLAGRIASAGNSDETAGLAFLRSTRERRAELNTAPIERVSKNRAE